MGLKKYEKKFKKRMIKIVVNHGHTSYNEAEKYINKIFAFWKFIGLYGGMIAFIWILRISFMKYKDNFGFENTIILFLVTFMVLLFKIFQEIKK